MPPKYSSILCECISITKHCNFVNMSGFNFWQQDYLAFPDIIESSLCLMMLLPHVVLSISSHHNFHGSLPRVFPCCFRSSLFLFDGVSVFTTFLSMCSSSLLIACEHELNRLSVIPAKMCCFLVKDGQSFASICILSI